VTTAAANKGVGLIQKRLAMVGITGLVAVTALAGQSQEPFRTAVDFVTTDVIVRKDGQFVADLRQDEFRLYEDDVPQAVTLFEPVIGGRSLGNLVAMTPTPSGLLAESLILPTSGPAVLAGRLFMIFIDDLHFQPSATPAVRDLLRKVRDTLIHDDDLVAFVSSGRSSIALSPSYDYDQRRFNEAIDRTIGSADSPDEILAGAEAESAEGPQGLRYNAHVAFQTVYDTIDQLASITDRRKIFIYVSNGYNFNPFTESRFQKIKDAYANAEFFTGGIDVNDETSLTEFDERESLREEEYRKRTAFSFAELTNELVQIERAAQRANVTFYPIDPRGMIPYGDARTTAAITYNDWRDNFQTQINSLRVLAEGTGGFCVCGMNDFNGGLSRIDAETSDFYRIGYTSNNSDPRQVRRSIRIEITRPGLDEPVYRREYTIRRSDR